MKTETTIVTGAGSGIGRATALAFARAGASILALDIEAQAAEETVSQISATGGRGMAIAADVGDEDQVAAAVREGSAALGPISVLINNAGVMDDMRLPDHVPLELWERVLRVNLTGSFLMARAVLPGMLERGRGAIVNVASEAGARGGVAGISYTAAKHGVIGLTRSLAYAYGDKGIRTNAILPGPVATGIRGSLPFDPEGLAKLEPVRSVATALSGDRLASPEEMASVLLFLASDAASSVNGALVAADAGWLAG